MDLDQAGTIGYYELIDGNRLPRVGFGTYPLRHEAGVSAMVRALDNGYRLIDSAVNYENEVDVGPVEVAHGRAVGDVERAPVEGDGVGELALQRPAELSARADDEGGHWP